MSAWTFAGSVVQSDGTPASNQTVIVKASFSQDGGTRIDVAVPGVTASDGTFSIPIIADTFISSSVVLPDNPVVMPGGGQIQATNGTTVQLTPVFVGLFTKSKWTVTGVIKDNSGTPIANYNFSIAWGYHSTQYAGKGGSDFAYFPSDGSGNFSAEIKGGLIDAFGRQNLDWAVVVTGNIANLFDRVTGGIFIENLPGAASPTAKTPNGSTVATSNTKVLKMGEYT